MKNKYEAVIVLNTQGKEDSVEKMVSQVGREIEAEGARLEQVDQLGRREFVYTPRKLQDGFYVNYHFEADSSSIDKVRNRLKLNSDVFLQHYQRRD